MNDVLQLLGQYGTDIAHLGGSLRNFLREQLQDCTEQPDPAANIIGYGYGNGYKDMICTIIPSRKGIKLGFAYGAALADPAGLLQGSGKVHKYIPLQTVADFDNEAVRKLLYEAIKARKLRRTNTK